MPKHLTPAELAAKDAAKETMRAFSEMSPEDRERARASVTPEGKKEARHQETLPATLRKPLPEGFGPAEAVKREAPSTTMSLEEVRQAFAKGAYALLMEDRVWFSLRRLLTKGTAKTRLAAFDTLLAALLPHTKPEEGAAMKRPMAIQIVNNIQRPGQGGPEPVTIEVPL